MAARDFIGKRGEAIVSQRLLDPCGNPFPYFAPYFLGDKSPTFDYLVELVNAGHSAPYFFVQVRATRKSLTKKGLRLQVGLSRQDVRRMVQCPIPTYLFGVDEPAEKVYIVAIHGDRKGPISSIPTRYPLDCANLKKLWDEVRACWLKLDPSGKSSSFTV